MTSKLPNLEQRKLGLTSLIEDCIEMGANKLLIENYKKQLKELVDEEKNSKKVKVLNNKRNSKIVPPNSSVEVKNHPNLICFVDLYKSPVIEDIERENKELYQNEF